MQHRLEHLIPCSVDMHPGLFVPSSLARHRPPRGFFLPVSRRDPCLWSLHREPFRNLPRGAPLLMRVRAQSLRKNLCQDGNESPRIRQKARDLPLGAPRVVPQQACVAGTIAAANWKLADQLVFLKTPRGWPGRVETFISGGAPLGRTSRMVCHSRLSASMRRMCRTLPGDRRHKRLATTALNGGKNSSQH